MARTVMNNKSPKEKVIYSGRVPGCAIIGYASSKESVWNGTMAEFNEELEQLFIDNHDRNFKVINIFTIPCKQNGGYDTAVVVAYEIDAMIDADWEVDNEDKEEETKENG